MEGTYASVHVSEPACVSGHECVLGESGYQGKTGTDSDRNSEALLSPFPEPDTNSRDLTEFFKYPMKSQCYDDTHL